MKKLPVSELLRLACLYAESHQLSLIDAYNNNDEEETVKDAKSFLNQLKEYRIKRWGKTRLETEIENTPLKSLSEIKEIIDKENEK